MVLHHGDRIVKLNKNFKKLEFGRVHHYVNDESFAPSPPRSKLSKLGDYLNTSEYKRSSGNPSPVSTKTLKSLEEVNAFGLRGISQTPVKKILWDDGRTETELQDHVRHDEEQIYRVFDRKFSPGQRIIRKGRHGRIIDVIPLATVKIVEPEHSKGYIIPDVGLNKIKPLSDLFTGVTIIYNNHLGIVQDVQRRTLYCLNDGSKVTRTAMDSQMMKESQPQRVVPLKTRNISHLFTYPFSSFLTIGAPYPNKQVKVPRAMLQKMLSEMEKDKENQPEPVVVEQSLMSSLLSRLSRKKPAETFDGRCVDSEVTSMKVKWIGQLPSHLFKTSSKNLQGFGTPPAILSATHVKQVIPLYIPISMYLDKPTTVASITTDIPTVNECAWSSETYRSLSPIPLPPSSSSSQKFDLSLIKFGIGIRKQEKETQDSEKSTPELPRDYLVTKHSVRHKYQVLWDPKNGKSYLGAEQETGIYFGSELEPDATEQHNLYLGRIHSHLYVVAKKGNWMDGKWDYGVVIEKLDSQSVVVEWFRINESNGSVKNNRILKCSLMDIDKHPTYNDFHEGRIVVRSQAAGNWKTCRGFKVGTVKNVKRFSMGQILVHCALSNSVVELWPHMLELFVWEVMDKNHGANRSKSCLNKLNMIREDEVVKN